MKLFLDTNVWIRNAINEGSALNQQARLLIQEIEKGDHAVYTSSIVLLECSYVFEKVYQQPKKIVLSLIDAIAETRNITVIEKTNFSEAFHLHKKTKKKLSDCIIATQIPKDVYLCSFDRDMFVLHAKTILPENVIS